MDVRIAVLATGDVLDLDVSAARGGERALHPAREILEERLVETGTVAVRSDWS